MNFNWFSEHAKLCTVLIGGIGTISIFSFLIKENALYRFFEHLFIGISAGLGLVLTFTNFLWPQILVPLFGLDIHVYPDGTLSEPYSLWRLLYIPPMLFGLLFYFILSPKHSWLAKLVIGFTLGASGALAFKGFFNEMLPQVFSSFKPLVVFDAERNISWLNSINNIVFVVTLLAVMNYFFFSFKQTSKIQSKFRDSGRWLMMICFGAFFGSTVMARMALLVERIQFLLDDWWKGCGELVRMMF